MKLIEEPSQEDPEFTVEKDDLENLNTSQASEQDSQEDPEMPTVEEDPEYEAEQIPLESVKPACLKKLVLQPRR